MKIPFGTISVTEKSKRLINEILESNRLSSGKYVREFEKKFAELVGTKEAVAVGTGTDADALALAVLYDFDAKRGDEIITNGGIYGKISELQDAYVMLQIASNVTIKLDRSQINAVQNQEVKKV